MKVSIRRLRSCAGLALLGGLALAAAPAAAQPRPTPGSKPAAPAPAAAPAAPAGDDQDAAARQAEARGYFTRGLAFFEKEAWEAALAEFLRSRKAAPTRAATKYAASCLRELRRFDEALDLYEEVLTFPNLSAKDQKFAQDGVAAMTARVGTLAIQGGEKGASVIVDGRFRGTLPLPGPLRVIVGSHEIGAFREGGDPYGATVDVGAKQSATAELRSRATGGRLKVGEQRGRTLDVVVDGIVVGKTPWEGPVAVGEHVVTLRGSGSLDAECAPAEAASSSKRPPAREDVDLGTQPVTVPIRLQKLTALLLAAEELDTTLRIEPTPGGASIAVDSVTVGRGAWEGRLRVGEHRVEVMAEGFLPEVRRVVLERRKRQVVRVDLERDRNTPEWRAARNGWAGAALGVGGLGLGLFAVTGGLALSRNNELKAACLNGVCPPAEQQTLASARTFGTLATVGAVVGGVGLATGAVVLLVARPGGGDRRRGGGFVWTAGVTPGGVEVNGAF
jgi:hypothetical protein